jgi:hypothetical protein
MRVIITATAKVSQGQSFIFLELAAPINQGRQKLHTFLIGCPLGIHQRLASC